MIDSRLVWSLIQKIRSSNPLIHNITNYVVMNQTANALLAIGASPVMAHAPEELAEIATKAQALVINIGTLSASWINSMKIACEKASKARIPVILDPVGSGFTKLRTDTARELLASGYVDIIRCNASEAASLILEDTGSHGVDSAKVSHDIVQIGKQIVAVNNITLCISGQTDFIISKDKVYKVTNGHPLMTKVTGMGCVASALTGAFAACAKDFSLACASTMFVMGICGERAAERSKGTGSFQANFLDELWQLTFDTVHAAMKLEDV